MFEGRDVTSRRMRSVLGGATWWRDELSSRREEDVSGAKEAYFRDIFEKAPVGVLLEDAGGRLVESNPALQKLLGYNEEELLGRSRASITHPEDEAKDAELYGELLRGEREGFQSEKRYVRKDGGVVWGRLSTSALTDAGGRPALVVAAIEDISERKRTEEELEKREEHYRAVVEQSAEGIFLNDVGAGSILETNQALRALLGYPAGELEGMEVYDLIVSPREEIEREVRLALEERGRYAGEWKLRRRDGSILNVEASVGVISYGGREVVCTTVRDATERKEVEEALRHSERRLAAVIEQSPLSIHIFSPEGHSLASNASWNELWGLEEGEEPEGTNIFDDQQLIESGLLEYVRESLRGVRVVTPPLFYDPAKTGRNDPPRWLEAYVYPVQDEGGGMQEMVLVIEEVTEREEAREELKKSEERFRSLIQNSSDIVTILDEDGAIRYESPAVERVLGYRAGERLGARIFDYVHPEEVERAEAGFAETRETPGVRPPERFRKRHKDGSWRHIEVIRTNLLHDPNIKGIVANLRDVTDRVRAEEDIRVKNRAIDASSNGILICDMTQEDYPIVYCNSAMARITGYAAEEILGRNPRFLQGLDSDQIEARRLAAAIEEEREWFGVIRNYKKDGTLFYNEMYVAPVRDEGGTLTHYVGVQNDVTERKAMEEQLAYQAFHDSLTGLPNRALFKDRLDQALARADRHGNAVAVLYMDVDNFKYVNDSLGHEGGDELLIGVAERLRWSIRPGDTAARLGGDEFAVLLEEIAGVEDATKVAGRIAEELREPLVIRGQEVFASASIGVAASARGGGRAGDLLRDADAAMYEAKREGKNRHKVFEAGMGHRSSERLGLENDLRRAMRRGEFRLHYQPEVLLQAGRTVGVEALLRWERPGRGIVSPAEFIPVAEETGLIVPMGHWVLREACRQAREWRGRYADGEAPTVWVNLSARQLYQTDLGDDISGILEEAGVPPDGLGLEITESVLVEYGGTAISTLDELKALGVRLAIDDFGTGYSSLSYLKRLPVDSLKIDRSFVSGIDTSAEDEVLIAAVIKLAQALNLKVVAEGVETGDQLRKLRSLGCDLAQGYHFSRPLPAETALPFLFEEW